MAGMVAVGVDGSRGSRAALDFALEEAVMRQLPVAAVVAVENTAEWIGVVVPQTELQNAARRDAQRVVDEAVADFAERTNTSGAPPEVDLWVRPGSAREVLAEVSEQAALLVVGHRGRSATLGRLMGSVGLSCVVHAKCNTVVVRAPEEGLGDR